MDGRRGVVFDVDGTLVDSNYLHCLAWARAFREHGHDVPMAGIHRCVGTGAALLVETLLGAPDERVQHAHSARYAELSGDLRPLPEAVELLREVRRRGGDVLLATSAQRDEAEMLLRVLDVDDVVDAVTSAADVENAKPAPELFLRTLSSRGLDPSQALVVGDTTWDMTAAGRAGLGAVAVLTGGIARSELLAAGALAVYDGPADLLARIDDSPLAALLATGVSAR